MLAPWNCNVMPPMTAMLLGFGGKKIGDCSETHDSVFGLPSSRRKKFGDENRGMSISTFFRHAQIGAVSERVGQGESFNALFGLESSCIPKLVQQVPALTGNVRPFFRA